MAGPAGDVGHYRKGCVCGPFHNEGKINYPLWWYGDQGILYNFAGYGSYVVPTNCAFMGQGQYFNGGNSHLLDEQGRKILKEATAGLWSSINLDCTRPPVCGSIVGSGTKLYLNDGNALPPKITGSLILYPQGCPNLAYLYCDNNSISVLDVSALTSLAYLYCDNNSISVLDVSALTSLTHLYCYNNSILTLDVSALTSLVRLYCYGNSILTLDVSALTSLTHLYCYNNSILTLDVSALTSLAYLSCGNNSILTLDVSALTSLVYLNCYNNSISVLDVSALTSLIILSCHDNSISVLDVSALTSLTTLYCHNNSMNQAMVDTVLCDVDGFGTNNGILNISGNAVPSAAGTTCKNNLVGRGWTVTTD